MVCNTLIHHTTDISIKQKGKSKSGYNSCFARQQSLYYRKHAIVGIKLCILYIYYIDYNIVSFSKILRYQFYLI